MLNGEKAKAFPLRSGTRQGCPPLTTDFQHHTECPIRQEKEIKCILISKEEITPFVCR